MRIKKAAGAYHHQDLRRALLQAALQLIESQGVDALTLREAARRTGVTHSAAYRHFVDKQALVAALAEEGFRGLDAALAKAQHGIEHDPVRALEAAGVAYVTYALEHRAHFQVMFAAPIERGSGQYPSLDEAANATFERLLRTVRDGQLRGRFRGTDPMPAAMAAWSLVHGLAQLLIDSLLPHKADPARFARKVIEVALKGVIAPE